MRMEFERAFARRRSQAGSAAPATFLALSAGQEDGAFAAGLLVGWSEHGGRPEFQIVTGTSTGALAASENPDRLELVRRIILASAAVPGLFPPIMIDASLKDRRYQEMHVDGGTVAQMFLYPPSLDMVAIVKPFAAKVRPTAYIIRNGRVSPEPEEVERGTLQIAGRAVTTMVASNAVGKLYRIYTTTQRDHIDFKLALIKSDFTEPYKRRFDHDYMNELFAYGRAKAVAGYAWQTTPPGFVPASR